MIAVEELLPDEDYRFHLTLRRGDPREFFRPHDTSGALLAERARWLVHDPARYAARLPEGEPLLQEFAALLEKWEIAVAGPVNECALGSALEPDVLLLQPDGDGRFRLLGGALVFPTGWALTEKLGQTVDFIHDVVPGLNPALGATIHQFLSRLRPGIVFHRANWGIAATDELNAHPSRGLPAPESPVALERLWLRVEHQALLALPETRGVVFGIRVTLHRLDQIGGEARAAAGLCRALETMPVELARYKRIEGIRTELAALL